MKWWRVGAFAGAVTAVLAAPLAGSPSLAAPASATQVSASPVSPAQAIPGPTGRIVGGAISSGDTGWFASLSPTLDGSTYLCGGTVIGARWILTAAHCVTDDFGGAQTGSEIAASRAYIDPSSLDDASSPVHWSAVIRHPSYNPDTQRHDIALIQTATAMAGPSLPYSADAASPLPDAALEVFGFGRTSSGGSLSKWLRVAAVNDLAGLAGACGEYGSDFSVSSMICAGRTGGGVDACQGDSGGPLTTPAGTRRLVGIVSTGTGCALAAFPGIYTRVSAHADWVHSVTGIPPDAVSTPHAVLSVRNSCSKRGCRVGYGRAIRVAIQNIGSAAGPWAVGRSSKLVKSALSGWLESGQESHVTFRPRRRAPACTVINIVGDAGRVAHFPVALNGARC